MTTFVSRRAKRRGLLAVAALVVVGLLIGLALWTRDAASSTRSPLGPSNGGGADIDSPLFYRSVDPEPFGDEKTNIVLRFKPHSELKFGFNILNRGDSPLRIDGVVPPPEGWLGMAPIRRLLVQHKPRRYTIDGATEAPLTIAPGKDGFVIPVIETGGPCRRHFVASSGESFDQVHLRYRYRGRDRTEWYSLPFTVRTVCGNPKLLIDQITSP